MTNETAVPGRAVRDALDYYRRRILVHYLKLYSALVSTAASLEAAKLWIARSGIQCIYAL
jgi:hypothetical protein